MLRLVLPLLLLLLARCTSPDDGTTGGSGGPRFETVTIAGETFELELAVTDATRERGLMGRTEVPADGGMLFVFPRSEPRSFWMKNCLTDIDIAFLDSRGRVTAIHEMTIEPPRADDESELAYELRLPGYRSGLPAQFAIELAPGSFERLGVRVADRIELDLERLKGLAEGS